MPLRDRYNAYVRACKAADVPHKDILTFDRWCREFVDCCEANRRGIKALPNVDRTGLEGEFRQETFPVRHKWGRRLAEQKRIW